MDGLVPYASGPPLRPSTAPLTAHAHAHAVHYAVGHSSGEEHNPLAKTPADYLRAVRQRFWVVLAVAAPIIVGATLLVLRMPAVYQVTAEVIIEPPRPNSSVISIVNPNLAPKSEDGDDKFMANKITLLRSKSLIQSVLSDPALGFVALPGSDDPAGEVSLKLTTRNIPKTNFVQVSLEGDDPLRTTRLLNYLLDKFKEKVQLESNDSIETSKQIVNTSLGTLNAELKALDTKLYELIRSSNSIGIGGKSIKMQEFENLGDLVRAKKAEYESLSRNFQLKDMDHPQGANPYQGQIENLKQRIQLRQKQLNNVRRAARNAASDPAFLNAYQELATLTQQLHELETPQADVSHDQADSILAGARDEIAQIDDQRKAALREMKDALPEYQDYLKYTDAREQKARQIAELNEQLSEFEILSKTRNSPVTVTVQASEPTSPIKPKRSLYIAAAVFFAFGLGIGLVCLVEHLDHSVKVPEHLTAGLGLPLFGVVPWIHRSALNHKGGHLWVQGALDSHEADAYRNLRASLLGVACAKTRLRTILITSAKSHEGKSTTALNLATTCARAGERTLLMDVDLRRSSLGDVFPVDEHELGLVDVLKGELPWQRTVISTDIPNLDFLPTGSTAGVPIEVLGSRELRQLLISLSEHHYDRIIIDGPAILGLADCRMLGRMVDASVLVVRSGALELRPLQRAKAMLEQSKVWIAGVVFNGVRDDLQNWSSLAPGMPRRLSGLEDDGLDAPAPLTALAGESH